ncbi:autophagy-related protein 29 [Aspergillus sclerotioniger CBS 115572]|uniref:Autophagy-related protein 29 n=1 Tax=Aspergillus sclerotioniger CBS 115572 TaxID=1450535 RepID=A0A317UYS8_9EURO|nr:autophagy-related protein 29 [Aspergillus sclerotioniger CBS 115572]PWY67224.1 autophagy-related protein 29 [Aspergillus sclerotioniger CBS 115572]
MTSLNQSGDTKFTVFIRLPFPRGDFVDPPPVEWNAAKDQALWDILSRLPKGDDLDCKALADRFDVTLQFLLQQAAWLYDRQLSQVRAQMLKVPTQSNPASPAPGGSVSGSMAQVQETKNASNAGPRAPSRLSLQQKDTLPQRAPLPRRTSSTTTVNQVKNYREAFRNNTPVAEPKEPSRETYARHPVGKREQVAAPSAPKSPALEDDITSSSSESESESDDDKFGSRYGLRFRPPFGTFSTHRPGFRDDEEDDDESPAFIPEPGREPHETSQDGLDNTLRTGDLAGSHRRPPAHPSRTPKTTESSASSASSGVPVAHPRRMIHSGPLSPRRHAELSHLSPRQSLALRRDASDGTPSMGSSYSDLDDASVTQSALEEAFMSNMQHGGMASRMSILSQAIRSKYLSRAEDRFS